MPDKKRRWPIEWTINVTIKPLAERHFVTLAIFALSAGLLLMAREDPALWDIELFKIILQAVLISGVIGMIMAFHFSANKGDETKTDNTAKAFEAITATAATAATAVAAVPGDTQDVAAAAEKVAAAAEQVAAAAQHEADLIGDAQPKDSK